MKERFTEQEWGSVLAVLKDGVVRVAKADPAGEETEYAQIIEDLVLARSSNPDPLLREVATSVWSSIKKGVDPFDVVAGPRSGGGPPTASEDFLDFLGTPLPPPTASSPKSPIDKAKQVLRAKLSEDEYGSYLTAVLFEALKVAKAAGEQGAEVSSEEATALGDFARDWEIDLAPLWQRVSDWRKLPEPSDVDPAGRPRWKRAAIERWAKREWWGTRRWRKRRT
jgi:hypothetical protein